MTEPALKVAEDDRELFNRNLESALTPNVVTKVKRFAYRRYMMLKRAGVQVDEGFPNQIYADVVTDTTIGRLTWRTERTKLSIHLCGAIKSRTHQMLLRHQRHQHLSLSGRPQDILDFEPTESAVETEASLAKAIDFEQHFAEKDRLERVRAIVRAECVRRDDHVAVKLLDALVLDFGARRDLSAIGISEKQYDAGRKRLERLLQRLRRTGALDFT